MTIEETTTATGVLLTNEKKVALLRVGLYLLVLGMALAAAGSVGA